jgi:hypothetical protein
MSGIVQIKLLGYFGNQLHQYAAARAYAQAIDAVLEVPADWVGRRIFVGHDKHPTFSRELPERNGGDSGAPPWLEWGESDVRLAGYFQMSAWAEKFSRAELRSWFQVNAHVDAACGQTRTPPGTIAAHLRQGDYIGHYAYCNVTQESYLLACLEHDLDTSRLVWVAQDSAKSVPGVPGEFSYLPDWLTLVRADILLRANSTFSWWAGALSQGDVYSPVVDDKVGWNTVPFVKGNHPRCAHTDRHGVKIEDLYVRP